ncbi:MAG: NUDIX hydrolase [Chloroflexi bacterium]|nr:NUDIX hydrolase [Chloroflexota bacterium]
MAEPRLSASVILVRDGPIGLETFMVRRHASSPAFPSAYVFPGGTVHDEDLALQVADSAALTAGVSARADTKVAPEQAKALYVCAVRELFEEAGVLLVRDATGRLLEVDVSEITLQERLESMRLRLQAHELSLAEVLADHGWQPAFDRLVPFSHWITPAAVATRFDTRFFVADLPRGQSALHDTIETSEGIWLTPARALEADYHTLFPTTEHLKRLAAFPQVADLLEFGRTKPIRTVTPDLNRGADGARIAIRPNLVDAW